MTRLLTKLPRVEPPLLPPLPTKSAVDMKNSRDACRLTQ